MTRLGYLQTVQPSASSGWVTYDGPGRLFLPAATGATAMLCPDPQGTLADGTFWPADTANTDTTANQALPVPISGTNITKCLKLVNDGTADAPVTANLTVVASTSYNDSIYVYAPTLGGNLTITSEVGHTFTVAALTAANTGFVRYSVQANTVAGEVVKGLKFTFAGGTASTVYVTGYNPVAASLVVPYFDGSSTGGGCAWTGTANASTSTRAASVLTYPQSAVPVATGGTVALRFSSLGTQATVGAYSSLFSLDKTGGAAYGWVIRNQNGSGVGAGFYDGTDVVSTDGTAFAAASTKAVVARWLDAATLDCSVNGTPVAQVNAAAVDPTYAGSFYIGTQGTNYSYSYIGPFAISPTRVADAETATLSTMLTAGATGADLVRFFRDRSYSGTLVIPLASDGTAYKLVG
jgi:hypothetical protein